uniref:Phosphoglycerate_mutase n=1 Tax=Arundo donax TaxID=35708 RepID=A0A0A9D6P5_ARUDO
MERLWVCHLMMTWATVKLATTHLVLVAFLLKALSLWILLLLLEKFMTGRGLSTSKNLLIMVLCTLLGC